MSVKLGSVLTIVIIVCLSFNIIAISDGYGPNVNLSGNLKITENKGQWDSRVIMQAKLNSGTLHLEKDKFTFQLFHPEDWDRFYNHSDKQSPTNTSNPIMRSHTYHVIFNGANPNPEITGSYKTDGYSNYFKGQNPEKWATKVRSFKLATYHQLYDNIDLVLYQENQHLKYDILVSPGARAADIELRYEYTEGLSIKDGQLIVSTSVNTVTELKPFAYQIINGEKKEVACEYVLSTNKVSFHFPDGYDAQYLLVIDPVLTFSTYSGSKADNFGFTATFDLQGNLYGGGIVFDQGYPITPGAYQTTWQAGIDIGITKFNDTGTSLIYSTYLGGNSDETPNSLVVNNNDELVIYGLSSSTDFPVTNSAFDQTFNGGTPIQYIGNGTNFTNGTDIIVSILSADGSSLLGSTYIGGTLNDGLNDNTALTVNYGDLFRGEVIVDASNNIYVASSTVSTNFPTTPGSFQQLSGGGQDAVIFKFSPDLTTLIWCTYLGSTNSESGYSLKLDNNNNLFVTGGTSSLLFPTTPGSYNSNPNGGTADGYISKFSNNGASLLSSTFIGTVLYDQIYFVEIDADDDIYVVGQTSGFFTVTPGVYSNANSGQFISKLDNNLSNLVFSTVFGKGNGSPELSPTAFLVDDCKSIYVAGWGGTTNTITDRDIRGMPLKNAFQSTSDGSDFYFIVLSRDAENLSYATYFGGDASSDHVDGGTSRFDKNGAVYQAVCASCGAPTDDFPTTAGAWSSRDSSINCNLAVFKFEFQLTFAKAEATVTPNTDGCVPHAVSFESTGSIGFDYAWDFGDGNTSILPNPFHTYNTPGNYTIMFITLDTFSCNSADTAFLNINVFDQAIADFNASTTNMEFGTPVNFSNMSTGASSYLWDFGDGNSSTATNPTHTYQSAGDFQVCLFALNPSGGCNDTICVQLKVFENFYTYIPNAFSPNGDNVNDIFYVVEEGLETGNLIIYNRWGEIVYQSNDLSKGWDGTYKGEKQEIAVYAVYLEGYTPGGQQIIRQGNVTLLR